MAFGFLLSRMGASFWEVFAIAGISNTISLEGKWSCTLPAIGI